MTDHREISGIIEEFLVDELTIAIGNSHRLRGIEWGGDDDGTDEIVVRDSEGRSYEVEIDVHVLELTEAVLAQRASLLAEWQAKRARGEV